MFDFIKKLFKSKKKEVRPFRRYRFGKCVLLLIKTGNITEISFIHDNNLYCRQCIFVSDEKQIHNQVNLMKRHIRYKITPEWVRRLQGTPMGKLYRGVRE